MKKSLLVVNKANGLTRISIAQIEQACFDKLDELDEIVQDLRVNHKSTSNALKDITRTNFILDRIQNIPADVIFEVEGCYGDAADEFFPNGGSVVECAVKYFVGGQKSKVITKSADYASDLKMGCMPYEVKTSLSPRHLATPSKQELTLLVNNDGAVCIKKAEVEQYLNKQGRLPFSGEGIDGYRPEWLNKALGYEC